MARQYLIQIKKGASGFKSRCHLNLDAGGTAKKRPIKQISTPIKWDASQRNVLLKQRVSVNRSLGVVYALVISS